MHPIRSRESQGRFPAIAKYTHEEYLKQKDNLYAAQKRYYARLGPKHAERRRAFYAENRERLQARQREYNAKNKEKRAEYAKEDAARHFFRIRANNLKTRHPEQVVASKLEIAGLWRRQKGICPFTGVRLNEHNAQLDHIIPLIRGGSGTIENLRWILRDANYAKRDLTDEAFLALCKQIVSYRKEST